MSKLKKSNRVVVTRVSIVTYGPPGYTFYGMTVVLSAFIFNKCVNEFIGQESL